MVKVSESMSRAVERMGTRRLVDVKTVVLVIWREEAWSIILLVRELVWSFMLTWPVVVAVERLGVRVRV